MIGDIGEKEPENKARRGVEYIIVYCRELAAENNDENEQVKQRLEETPEKAGNGVLIPQDDIPLAQCIYTRDILHAPLFVDILQRILIPHRINEIIC